MRKEIQIILHFSIIMTANLGKLIFIIAGLQLIKKDSVTKAKYNDLIVVCIVYITFNVETYLTPDMHVGVLVTAFFLLRALFNIISCGRHERVPEMENMILIKPELVSLEEKKNGCIE